MTVKEATVIDRKIKLRGSGTYVEFHGQLLVDVSWDASQALRWTDMALYKIDPGGRYTYLLQTVGRSIVYHRIGGCRAGVRIPVSLLHAKDPRWNDLEPCDRNGCEPEYLEKIEERNPEERVSVEEDRFRVYKCVDAEELVATLRDENGAISGPGTRLLSNAAMYDPDIRDAMSVTESL